MGVGGGEEVFDNVYFFMSRGSAPRSNPLTFRIFYYLLLTNDTPVYMTIVQLCTFFFNLNKSQNQNMSRIFTAIKYIFWPFWAF